MFKEKKEIELFYKKLKFGNTIRVKRDLSMGDMQEDMIQDLSIKIFHSNREFVYKILTSYPVLELEVLKY